MSSTDNSFDAIFSLLCIHKVGDEKERGVACCEITRVSKPGETALLPVFGLHLSHQPRPPVLCRRHPKSVGLNSLIAQSVEPRLLQLLPLTPEPGRLLPQFLMMPLSPGQLFRQVFRHHFSPL